MSFEKLELLNASEIIPEAVCWLWRDWLASGKLHILAGSPGTGKTSLALSFASILSTGGVWPNGEYSKKMKAIIWSGEDSAEDTLVPRLLACGADLKNIEFVGEIYTSNNKRRSFDPASDMPLLRNAINNNSNIGMIIIDSIVSAVGNDTHKNGEVRRGLQPLVDIANEFGCAIVGINHLSKGTLGKDPVERINGSIAFGALARVVFIAIKTNQLQSHEPPQRLIVRAKNNLGPDRGGFYYTIREKILPDYPEISSTYTEWGEYVDDEARDLISRAENSFTDNLGELASAKEFLKNILKNGPVASVEVFQRGRANGYSDSTIRRAQKSLGIKSLRQNGFSSEGRWIWALEG